MNHPTLQRSVSSRLAFLAAVAALFASLLFIAAPPAQAQEERPMTPRFDGLEDCLDDSVLVDCFVFSGRVLLDGEPLADAQVAAVGTRVRGFGWTNADGEFSFFVQVQTRYFIDLDSTVTAPLPFDGFFTVNVRNFVDLVEDLGAYFNEDLSDLTLDIPLTSYNAANRTSSHDPLANATRVCIEDAVVQDDPAAAELADGDSFVSSTSGVTYLIDASGQGCSFGCYDGFDMNCDGKLGDYCPAEINRLSVAAVTACRETTTTY